jgi:ketosteroid isomerase-like protein
MNPIQVAPWIVMIALAGLAGCEKAENADAFPQAAADGWMGAFNSGDAPGVTLVYSEDAEVLPPDEESVAGHEAIEAFWAAFNPGQVRIEISEVSSQRLGPYWFRQGKYVASFPDEGEPRVGKFIELWKKVDSNWLLYRHMWNRNAPLPAPAPQADAKTDEPA